jgi:hypothetical protein
VVAQRTQGLSPTETQAMVAARSLPKDQQELFAELGLRSIVVNRMPAISDQLVPAISPHDVPMPTREELIKIGQRVLNTWNREIYRFICAEDAQDKQDKQRLYTAIMGKDTAAVAILTNLIITANILSPALAVPVAALIIRLLVIPAGKTLCEVWKEKLPA